MTYLTLTPFLNRLNNNINTQRQLWSLTQQRCSHVPIEIAGFLETQRETKERRLTSMCMSMSVGRGAGSVGLVGGRYVEQTQRENAR